MRVDQIEIHAGTVDFDYEPVRALEAKCEARTNFSKTPTIAEANAKLQEMAAGIGANAVINVEYDTGMSLTSWRSMKATGLAVKKLSDEHACPVCAELIKRAAVKCRFCGTDLADQRQRQVDTVPNVGFRTAASDLSVRRAPAIPSEPLRATDNSQTGIYIVIAVVVGLAILGALAS